MTEYAVLLPGNEAAWEAADQATRDTVYARHTDFAKALADRGHTVTGGAELTHSRTARIVRTADGPATDGPYAEAAEQLTGFYLVRTEDVDDLVDVCRMLVGDGAGEGGVEVRACKPGSGS